MSDPREWWINPETFIILDYEPKYDDGMFNVIQKSEYDALKVELETLKRVVTPKGYKIQQVNYEQWENALVENERLTEELAAAKGEVAEYNTKYNTLDESWRHTCQIVDEERERLTAELEQTKDYNKFLSEQLAANASSRSYFENECRKLEHELEAAKGEIVKDNEEYAKRDKRAGEECARLKLLAENYKATLAEIAALTSENGCVEMAADMAQSVLNEDER